MRGRGYGPRQRKDDCEILPPYQRQTAPQGGKCGPVAGAGIVSAEAGALGCPHRPGWGSRTTAPHDGPPIVRSNRLLFTLGKGRKHASRLLHGAQHYYTTCKERICRTSNVPVVIGCWRAARLCLWSCTAAIVKSMSSCGPRAPTSRAIAPPPWRHSVHPP